ncbi:hypothetical protein FOZ62_026879, partial [Perkinsus olseni]
MRLRPAFAEWESAGTTLVQQEHGGRIAGVDIRDVLFGYGDAFWLANRPLQSCEAAKDRLTRVNSNNCGLP